MSWQSIRPYFRERLDSLDLTEWRDGFNFENIPADILDNAYHVEFGEFTGTSLNQNDLESLVRVTIRVFRQGYSDPLGGIDDSIALQEEIVRECLKPTNRLTQAFKNVIFVTSQVRALDESNDNAMVTEVVFDVRVVLDVLN